MPPQMNAPAQGGTFTGLTGTFTWLNGHAQLPSASSHKTSYSVEDIGRI